MGSVRPTQGRTLAICQVNGGSQSFNTVSVLRNLGRWMRMWTIRTFSPSELTVADAEYSYGVLLANQSSIPMAWKAFSDDNRLMPSSNRDRLVGTSVSRTKWRHLAQLNPSPAQMSVRSSSGRPSFCDHTKRCSRTATRSDRKRWPTAG